MNNNLILTGWSKPEYVAGAAAALEVLKGKADVAGVSMNQLAGVMTLARNLLCHLRGSNVKEPWCA